MGEIEQSIIRQCIISRRPFPDRIANKPILKKGLDLYMQAFFDLDSERQVSMSISPIPWSSVANYSKFYKFDEYQTIALFYYIREMDNQHIKLVNAKNKK